MLCVDPCTLSNNLSKCLFSTKKHEHLTKHIRQNVIPKGQSKMTECNFMILAFLFRFKYGGRFRGCIYNPKSKLCAKSNAEHCYSENGVAKVRRAREEHAKNTRRALRKYEYHQNYCYAFAIRIFRMLFVFLVIFFSRFQWKNRTARCEPTKSSPVHRLDPERRYKHESFWKKNTSSLYRFWFLYVQLLNCIQSST